MNQVLDTTLCLGHMGPRANSLCSIAYFKQIKISETIPFSSND